MTLRFLALIVAATLASCSTNARPPGTITVAGASDLAVAFEQVGAAFEKKTGQKVIFTFGSTGLLAKQIKEGAPFDVFAAANVSYVDEAVSSGACDGTTKAMYARGRIAIWTGAGVTPPEALADLADPRFASISIANPEHAPYGRAAKEAMEKAGIWDTVKAHVVYGENVQQAMQYARSGNVDAAITALSLALAEGGSYVLVDDSLHAPIDQALAVCKHGSNATGAAAFVAFVGSPEGRAIMKRNGFLLPGETRVTR
jgi:molybdate transport system substrate-binding protein